ncbi:MAG: NADH-ubiquinone oxidoreductase-F iron-sulfur binding region domain-containing protein [Acidimicrobiia bacterium]
MTRVEPRAVPQAWAAGPTGLPRLLRGLRPDAALTIAEHHDIHGPMHLLRARELTDAVEEAGLRGRGGAGFPTATKLAAVATRRGPRVVVANGSEGEPASSKDELLLTSAPHLVLDGLVLAAAALDARETIIAVERTRPRALQTVTRAVAERAAAGVDPVSIRVVPVPGRYVAGEESALVHLLEGGDAKPTVVPPRPFERGVGGRPTLIQNVETLAHLALIGRHGPEWYRSVGTPEEPGSALVTLRGAVARPAVFEVALGSRFETLVAAAGGETEPVSAYLFGGYFGTWVRRDAVWGRRLSTADLRPVGASLGAGVVAALPSAVCGLVETARVMRYLSEETAGQCGSCVHGLRSISDRVDQIARSKTTTLMRDDLDRWSAMVEGRGACRMPDGAVRFLRSALITFADEIALHQRARCSATRHEDVLPIPKIGRDWGWR